MTNLLRRGRLEVETDLLLGVEEVLLPRGLAARGGAVGAEAALPAAIGPTAGGRPRFEAALFASHPPQAQASRAQQEVREHAATERVERFAAPVPEVAHPRAAYPSAPASEEPANIVESVSIPAQGSKAERLAELDRTHAAQCPHCTTATAHTRLVFGEGNPDADLMFVGEAPGETEDQLGRPFVGRAGEKLDEMISAMGLRREDVYIANVLKSRPPDNRTPLRHEVEQCGPYLLAQVGIIRPKAIVTLGGPASKLLLRSELGITRLRGMFGALEISSGGERISIPVMPTFHPAYLLRNYTPETRRQVWDDLKKVLAELGRDIPARR
ncbi:MAG: uracil-DNA glycosylase family protein [Planctomycetota bacterium]